MRKYLPSSMPAARTRMVREGEDVCPATVVGATEADCSEGFAIAMDEFIFFGQTSRDSAGDL
jgi:hypothetical protein